MEIDFKKIGKDSGYRVPAGFFEQISEVTLVKARQREKKHRKIQIAFRGFAFAASLSAIALIGYFMTNSEKNEVSQFVKKEKIEVTLKDVLPELTDDELLQMTIVYRTDPFIEDSQN